MKGILLAYSPAPEELAVTLTGRPALALPIANRPLARYGLEAMRGCGIAELAILVSPGAAEAGIALAEDAARLGLDPQVIETPDDGPVAALLAARDFVSDDAVLLHRADGFVAGALEQEVAAFAQDGADMGLLVPGADAGHDEAGALRLVTHARIPAGDDALAPAAVLGPAALGHAAAAAAAGRAPSTLVALALALREAGGTVDVRGVAGAWSYRDEVDDLLEGNRLVLDLIGRDLSGVDASQARIEGRVTIHRSAVVERTTIRGPAVIGPGAVLVDAFVGPYTSIGENVHLEGAEIEHSIVLSGAAIRHVGRRLEASIVGREANVHRDFELPAALRVRVGRRAEVSLA
jgi:glucose-1-phosphate thymidylyltransferase